MQEQLKKTQEKLTVIQDQVEELKKAAPPAGVKANVLQSGEGTAKKAETIGKTVQESVKSPRRIEEHRPRTCPVCEMGLGGISLARCRQVIDVPPPPPVEVVEHRIYKGWCSTCKKWREAPVDLSGQVIGQGRFGVRVASIVARPQNRDESARAPNSGISGDP